MDISNQDAIVNSTESNGAESTELIQLIQLPIIEQHLYPLKSKWQNGARYATSVVVTEENLQTVKNQRTSLRKQFEEFETLRKTIKNEVTKPYVEFEEIYKECISNPFKVADEAFKAKIEAVESNIKAGGEARIKDYFLEQCVANHVEWLSYEQLNIKMSKMQAKQKTQKSLKEQVVQAVERIAGEIQVIMETQWPDEIMVEYRKTLDMNGSFLTVKQRHAELANIQHEVKDTKEKVTQDKQAEEKVEALLPPTPVEPAPKKEEPKITAQFKVRDTKERLIALRTWLRENGYEIQ